MRRANLTGFTLVELLIALVIFSLLSVMSYRVLNAMLEVKRHVADENRKWQDLSLFFDRFEADITAIEKRTIRDAGGLIQPAWIGKQAIRGEDDAQLIFSRASVVDQTGQIIIRQQRLGYRFKQGKIEQLVWNVIDQSPYTRPTVYPLLSKVSAFKLYYLSRINQWQEEWPDRNALNELPKAVKLELTLDSGENIVRLFPVLYE